VGILKEISVLSSETFFFFCDLGFEGTMGLNWVFVVTVIGLNEG
jgi:hypothetical protein